MTWQQWLRKAIRERVSIFVCRVCGFRTDGAKPHVVFRESRIVRGQLFDFAEHARRKHGCPAKEANTLNEYFEGEKDAVLS